MKNSKFILTSIFILIIFQTYAQFEVSLNPISLIENHINVTTEFKLNNQFSLNLKTNKSFDHAYIHGKDCYDEAFFVNFMPRFYFNKNKLSRGFYASTQTEYGKYKNTYLNDYVANYGTQVHPAFISSHLINAQQDIPTANEISYELKRLNVGFATGFKFFIIDKIIIDGSLGFLKNLSSDIISENTAEDVAYFMYEKPLEFTTNISIGYKF